MPDVGWLVTLPVARGHYQEEHGSRTKDMQPAKPQWTLGAFLHSAKPMINCERMSRTQHLIIKIQHVCQEIRDIQKNRVHQKPQNTHMKPQASNRNPLDPQNHSNRTPNLNALPSPKLDKPIPRKESRIQTMMNNPNSSLKAPPLDPQNHAEHPILENPNFEKSANNLETTSCIDLETVNPTSIHQNHPTILFSGFMDKEWGKVQTEEGKGGGEVISNLCHMTKGCEATMSQETEAGAPQKAEVSMGQEIGE